MFFMWLTSDVATCMYYTGLDPLTKKPVHVARGLHDRKLQRALMQFFKPANYFAVREAFLAAGRWPPRPDRQRLRRTDPRDAAERGTRRPAEGCQSRLECGLLSRRADADQAGAVRRPRLPSEAREPKTAGQTGTGK
jgi:Domain of unknown function (DUF3362)